MINYYLYKGNYVNLITKSYRNPEDNIYTIIVGKNGTGKSTFLGSIVNEVLNDNRHKNSQDQSKIVFPDYMPGKIEYETPLNQVIAVSASPFDKFPISRRAEITRRVDEIEGYIYLGLRDIGSSNFSLGYMSKITASLLSSVQHNPKQIYGITKVLNYLGYAGIITAKLSLSSGRKTLEEFVISDDPLSFIKQSHLLNLTANRFLFREILQYNKEAIGQLIFIIKKFLAYRSSPNSEFTISEDGIHGQIMQFLSVEDLIFALQAGLFRLKDVSLRPLNGEHKFSIGEASSGEQSVILSILGIASQIKDNSLICIDEPEICLHPEWQEKYMQLLISTFKSYKKCHFIIATHSPQIISRLESENCFILSMETGEVRTANQFINNSADFQLVNVFNFPGFKNEYLSRIALNIFTKVNRRKHFDNDDLEKYKVIEKQSIFLREGDPVLDLFNALKYLHEMYA